MVYSLTGRFWVRLLLFQIVCALSLTTCELLLTFNLEGVCGGWILIYAAESALLTTPIWLLRGQWRLMVPIIIAVAAFFLWSNILYARFTQEFISPMLILSAQSYNPMVFSCVPSLVRVHDFIYLICAAIPFAAYCLLRVRQCGADLRFGLPITAMCVAFALISWPRNEFGGTSLRGEWLFGNLSKYVVKLVQYYGQSRPFELTETIANRVDAFVDNNTKAVNHVMSSNKDKNLIFIVVESLNAWVVGRDYCTGRSVTPTIDSLLRCDGTVSCHDVISQITCGESSDGQFIYNTGLLPLKSNPAAILFSQNKYKSLADALGYDYSAEYISEPRYLWNHSHTNQQYGYNALFDGLNYGAEEQGVGSDELIFSFVQKDLEKRPQPFFAFVTTITMHHPFEEKVPEADWINSIVGISERERRYLQMTHYFDACLGRFLKGLGREGLLKNSVVVLASDHHKEIRDAAPEGKPDPIVFMALNTGVTKRIEGPVGQVDVFPTVLDIMGVEGGWRGLGTSMLDSTNCSAVDRYGNLYGSSGAERDSLKIQAWDISDLMVRGNYFGKQY